MNLSGRYAHHWEERGVVSKEGPSIEGRRSSLHSFEETGCYPRRPSFPSPPRSMSHLQRDPGRDSRRRMLAMAEADGSSSAHVRK